MACKIFHTLHFLHLLDPRINLIENLFYNVIRNEMPHLGVNCVTFWEQPALRLLKLLRVSLSINDCLTGRALPALLFSFWGSFMFCM